MPAAPKSRVVLHTVCLCRGKHMAQGREGGGVAAVTEILYRVTLAEGRAQQGCCFPARYQLCPRYFEGRKHLNIAQGQPEELNTLLLLHSSVLEALCHMALKTSHDALAAESPEGLSCLKSSTPQGRESHISERDSSSPGDTSLFHSDTGNMTFKMGPVCS